VSTYRSLAERLSRGLVIRRRLPALFGGHLLYATPDAGLRFWRRNLLAVDRLLLSWVDELVEAGSVVWDLGANVGLFTLAAAHRASRQGSVVAVEPDDWLTSLIHRSVAAASPEIAPVQVLTAALSESVGLAEFSIARRSRAGSHLTAVDGSTQTGGSREIRTVVTLTGDWLLDHVPTPDLVKIDIEGAEGACLRGASRVLAEARPTILCEVSRDNGVDVAEILLGHDYVLFDAAVAPSERRPRRAVSWNTLAIPAERL